MIRLRPHAAAMTALALVLAAGLGGCSLGTRLTEVGTTPKVTRAVGSASATAKPSASANWKADTGCMIWSAVTTATVASGRRTGRPAVRSPSNACGLVTS